MSRKNEKIEKKLSPLRGELHALLQARYMHLTVRYMSHIKCDVSVKIRIADFILISCGRILIRPYGLRAAAAVR